MNDQDLPHLFVVFDEDGAPCHVDLDEHNAHAHINDAGADGLPVRDWIVRKYLPARKYEVASIADTAGATDASVSAFQTLKSALQADASYAWSWHCNLAMPIMDSIHCTPVQANKAGADLMQYLFDIDVRKFPEWHHDEVAPPAPSVADAAGASDLESLLADITAIDTWYRGSPSYEHDAGWFKDRVVRMLEEHIAKESK